MKLKSYKQQETNKHLIKHSNLNKAKTEKYIKCVEFNDELKEKNEEINEILSNKCLEYHDNLKFRRTAKEAENYKSFLTQKTKWSKTYNSVKTLKTKED